MNRWLAFSIALTVLAFASALYVYADRDALLPDKVPTHWDWKGDADDFKARDDMAVTLLLVPLMMVGALGLTFVLPWLSPRKFSLDTFRGAYNAVMGLLVALLGYIHLTLLVASTGHFSGQGTVRMMLGGLYLFFGLLGNLMGKVRRNFFVGIRTPWTLASETVWNQTHRVAAWLMVSGAVLAFLTVLLDLPFLIGTAIILLSALAPVVYSLVLYKRLEKQGKLVVNETKIEERGNQEPTL